MSFSYQFIGKSLLCFTEFHLDSLIIPTRKIKNFKRMTKWKPNVSLDKGIQITIDYLLDQKKL